VAGATVVLENLSWANTGNQAVTAYEVVTIKYDVFNRRLIGSKMIIGGSTSAQWEPLRPRASSQDGMDGSSTSHVHMGITYIRAVHYADGSVWKADPAQVIEAVRGLGIEVKELDETGPDSPQSRAEPAAPSPFNPLSKPRSVKMTAA